MKKERLSTLIIAIVAIGVAAFFYKRYHVPPVVDMPAIALTDLSGNKVSIQSYSGHPLFISFFATWCGPCIREMPELADLKEKLSDKKLQIVCISDESTDKLQRLQIEMGNELIILHSETSLHDIGVYTYPTNYIFNAKGKKVYDKVNPDHWNDPTLVERIRTLLD
ncbi:MAG: thiol:disulfide interchange protein tlpA [Bacteroidetes bacterium]|nr:thiol:disulfide interchange protein tlpA [Bacteroidota bacterium]